MYQTIIVIIYIYYFDANTYDEDFFLPSTVVLTMHITSSIISTLFYHQNSFKYQSVMFKLTKMITLHFVHCLVGYLLTSLNGYFLSQLSMAIWQWVTLSKIIINRLFPKLMYITDISLSWLILPIITHKQLMMVLHVPGYFMAQSYYFCMYMIWKHISSFQYPEWQHMWKGTNE